jgi:hypothetical protein
VEAGKAEEDECVSLTSVESAGRGVDGVDMRENTKDVEPTKGSQEDRSEGSRGVSLVDGDVVERRSESERVETEGNRERRCSLLKAVEATVMTRRSHTRTVYSQQRMNRSS